MDLHSRMLHDDKKHDVFLMGTVPGSCPILDCKVRSLFVLLLLVVRWQRKIVG